MLCCEVFAFGSGEVITPSIVGCEDVICYFGAGVEDFGFAFLFRGLCFFLSLVGIHSAVCVPFHLSFL